MIILPYSVAIVQWDLKGKFVKSTLLKVFQGFLSFRRGFLASSYELKRM